MRLFIRGRTFGDQKMVRSEHETSCEANLSRLSYRSGHRQKRHLVGSRPHDLQKVAGKLRASRTQHRYRDWCSHLVTNWDQNLFNSTPLINLDPNTPPTINCPRCRIETELYFPTEASIAFSNPNSPVLCNGGLLEIRELLR